MTATVAAPLLSGAAQADGLTFTASAPGGWPRIAVRTDCPTVAARLAERHWDVRIDSRPERPEPRPCEHCGGGHR